MARFVVALLLEPLEVGDGFTRADWPLHVTVVPPFETRADAERVLELITPVASTVGALAATGEARALFGGRHDIPVTTVAATPALRALHTALLDALHPITTSHDNPSFIRSGYRPHVTATKHGELAPGESVALRQLAVVDMRPDGQSRLRVVAAVVDL